MELIEKIAHAALERDSLQLRSLVQDFSCSNLELSKLPKPVTNNHNLLVTTAAITESIFIERPLLHFFMHGLLPRQMTRASSTAQEESLRD